MGRYGRYGEVWGDEDELVLEHLRGGLRGASEKGLARRGGGGSARTRLRMPSACHSRTTCCMYEYEVKKATTPSGTVAAMSRSSLP